MLVVSECSPEQDTQSGWHPYTRELEPCGPGGKRSAAEYYIHRANVQRETVL